MSSKSNNQGRGYEYACLCALQKDISKMRPSTIEKNSSFFAAEMAWNTLDNTTQSTYQQSALAFIQTLYDLEPLILENDNDTLNLLLQTDNRGQDGDVRDVLIVRKGIDWEIGLSIKHNHFAAKHSRLSKNLDFGSKWYGVPCSEDYWKDIKPIFDNLEKHCKTNTLWKNLSSKEDDVYVPLLTAFKDELNRQNTVFNKDIPKLMVEYLLGKYDFYKVIGLDTKRATQIHTYNLRGTLNQKGKRSKHKTILPVSALPTRIVKLDFKPNSKNTLELYLDNGWQFSFRIHNASSKVETSLKFDIQVVGIPSSIVVFSCQW